MLYENVLCELSTGKTPEPLLRKFEKNLLHDLGYALQFNHEAHSERRIEEGKKYLFIPQEGFSAVQSSKANHAIFGGKNLLKIAADDFTAAEVLRDAKR